MRTQTPKYVELKPNNISEFEEKLLASAIFDWRCQFLPTTKEFDNINIGELFKKSKKDAHTPYISAELMPLFKH